MAAKSFFFPFTWRLGGHRIVLTLDYKGRPLVATESFFSFRDLVVIKLFQHSIMKDNLVATKCFFHLETWWPRCCFDVQLQGTTLWPPCHFFFAWKPSGHQIILMLNFKGSFGGRHVIICLAYRPHSGHWVISTLDYEGPPSGHWLISTLDYEGPPSGHEVVFLFFFLKTNWWPPSGLDLGLQGGLPRNTWWPLGGFYHKLPRTT